MARNKKIEVMTYKSKGDTGNVKMPENKTNLPESPIETTPADLKPPYFLTRRQMTVYEFYVGKLIDLGIYADIDIWTLACYCKAFVEWQKISKQIESIRLDPEDDDSMEKYKLLNIELNRWYKQCRELGHDLGLNISSRCKLRLPEKDEEQENKFAQFLE